MTKCLFFETFPQASIHPKKHQLLYLYLEDCCLRTLELALKALFMMPKSAQGQKTISHNISFEQDIITIQRTFGYNCDFHGDILQVKSTCNKNELLTAFAKRKREFMTQLVVKKNVTKHQREQAKLKLKAIELVLKILLDRIKNRAIVQKAFGTNCDIYVDVFKVKPHCANDELLEAFERRKKELTAELVVKKNTTKHQRNQAKIKLHALDSALKTLFNTFEIPTNSEVFLPKPKKFEPNQTEIYNQVIERNNLNRDAVCITPDSAARSDVPCCTPNLVNIPKDGTTNMISKCMKPLGIDVKEYKKNQDEYEFGNQFCVASDSRKRTLDSPPVACCTPDSVEIPKGDTTNMSPKCMKPLGLTVKECKKNQVEYESGNQFCVTPDSLKCALDSPLKSRTDSTHVACSTPDSVEIPKDDTTIMILKCVKPLGLDVNQCEKNQDEHEFGNQFCVTPESHKFKPDSPRKCTPDLLRERSQDSRDTLEKPDSCTMIPKSIFNFQYDEREDNISASETKNDIPMTTSKQDFHCEVNVNSLAFNQANNRAIANVTTLYGRPDCQIDAPSDEELDVMHYDLPKKIFRLTPTLQKEPAKATPGITPIETESEEPGPIDSMKTSICPASRDNAVCAADVITNSTRDEIDSGTTSIRRLHDIEVMPKNSYFASHTSRHNLVSKEAPIVNDLHQEEAATSDRVANEAVSEGLDFTESIKYGISSEDSSSPLSVNAGSDLQQTEMKPKREMQNEQANMETSKTLDFSVSTTSDMCSAYEDEIEYAASDLSQSQTGLELVASASTDFQLDEGPNCEDSTITFNSLDSSLSLLNQSNAVSLLDQSNETAHHGFLFKQACFSTMFSNLSDPLETFEAFTTGIKDEMYNCFIDTTSAAEQVANAFIIKTDEFEKFEKTYDECT